MIKIGTLVKINGDRFLGGSVVGWYESKNDFCVHVFDKSEIYGLFFGEPHMSNGKPWYNVLVGERMFLFLMEDIEVANVSKAQSASQRV